MRVKGSAIAGLVLHILIGGLMILAGSMKVLNLIPSDAPKHGLGDHMFLIGTGELLTALLLIVPRTSSLGVLLASSFWGGAICIHMAHGESYGLVAGLLMLTWLGALLRSPAMFSSFCGSSASACRTEHDTQLVAH
jgi:hypothetical protein